VREAARLNEAKAAAARVARPPRAKKPAPRARRLATAVQWIAEGKPQGWKYRKQ
jgi:hypothetical protein